MDINRENCEAWFLDYFEGRLSPEQAEALFAFLDAHPDLHEIFNTYEHIDLGEELSLSFGEKESLKRFAGLPQTVNEANCEEFFVAAAEGTLNADERRRLEQFLAEHPERRTDYELFLQTRLQPEPIVFEDKASLRRTAETITADNIDEYVIASMEGLLNASQEKELAAFLAAQPEYAPLTTAYAQTRLQPEEIVFEDKASLHRTAETITADNIDEYVIASMEGLLNASQEKELAAFLAAHPEYAPLTAAYAQTRLQPETIVFEDKASLHRTAETITADNIDEYVIASMEGLLNSLQEKELAAFLVAHPEYAPLTAAYAQTRLQPETIVFEDKDTLKRRKGGMVWMPVWRAAAGLVLLAVAAYGVSRLLNEDSLLQGGSVASNDPLQGRKAVPVVVPVNGGNDAPAVFVAHTPSNNTIHHTTSRPGESFSFSFAGLPVKTITQQEQEPATLAMLADAPVKNNGTATQQAYPEYAYPSLREKAEDWALEKLGGKPAEPVTGVMAMREEKQKESLTGWDWAGLAMKKVSNQKVTLEKTEDDGHQLNVHLGKFRFSHHFKR